MKQKINLNADMGEGFGVYTLGNDAELLKLVGAANIACGYHAGDPVIMRETVRLANAQGVSIGAHPSFPDLNGFGRRVMTMAPSEIEAMLAYQVGALSGIAASENTRVTHVKPHGALNNIACQDAIIAAAIARAIKAVSESLILLAPAGSCLYRAGLDAGLVTASEVFADRAYDSNGNLVPRSQPGAVIHDPAECVSHVLKLLQDGLPGNQGDARERLPVHSVCVHGDTENALEISRRVSESLTIEGYELVPLPTLFNRDS